MTGLPPPTPEGAARPPRAMVTSAAAFFADGCGRCDRFASAACSARRWAPVLAALRDLCLAEGLAETCKWGHPCYTRAGRTVAMLGALRDGVRLGFFEAGLMANADGLLERQGPNARHPDTIRFTDPAQVTARADAIRAHLREAMGHADAGRRAPRDESEPDLPAELSQALDADPALAEAFAALTPGRRRSHAIAVARLRTAAARERRVEALRPAILDGKGAEGR